MTGEDLPATDLPESYSLDAFHRGRFVLVQPKRGHRAGMDALVLAAALPAGFTGHVVDLGAGAGAASLAVLSRCPTATALLVEREAVTVDAARLTLARPENQAFAARAKVLEGDVELSGSARAKAGLVNASADAVIMNPPFNAPDDRASADTLRSDAHVLRPGLLDAWVRTAAAIARSNGLFALIARPSSLKPALDALDGRFGAIELVGIHPRPDEPAIRFVIRGRKGSRAALGLQPPLVLHGPDGNGFTPRADDILNGRLGLFDA